MSKTTDDYRTGDTTLSLKGVKPLGGSYVMGYDPGTPQGDHGCITVWERVGIVRRILRRLRLDRSTWQYRIKCVEHIKSSNRGNQ